MSYYGKLLLCFVIGLAAFSLLVAVISPEWIGQAAAARMKAEGIISQNRGAANSKSLDFFYFNLASAIVPIVSYAVWLMIKRR
jgi:hypothetical protein